MSSSNTETRILQMQLENKDFEDGIRQTIKSLENLEEKLDLKNAGNGFEKVSAAANSVQMSHLESGLDSVTSKFTLMGQIGLRVLEDISSKVVSTGEKILRAATIQPMIDGWGEFEMKTNSVQTILGGIRNQFEDQPSAINAISVALDELNEYADKTIYNFAQMTENVGKFTNQGLGLEESTNAIKGIANWAAAVGANPQQMSRAMYNISQSLGAGSMQLIDWRSIRFANMATPEVKKLFAEVAKKQGTIGQNGMVRISKKQKVDVLEDFESSLKAGWLTNEVMAEAFSIYANAFSKEELIAKYGEELGTQFYEMGVYAEEAATKVRTFSQLLGVLQESLGSGWANTFDILFGGFEHQTEFLTAIKERIEEIINAQTDDRNNWLQSFSDSGGVIAFQNAILTAIDILSDFYWAFNNAASVVFDPFGGTDAYTSLATTWEHVAGIFNDINNTLTQFRTWMETANAKSGRSPLENLTSVLAGVGGAAGIAWQALKGFGKFAMRIFKRFEPLISSVLDLVGQLGSAVYYLFFNLTGQQSIEKLFDTIGDAVEPVVGFVVDLAAAVVDLVHSFLGIDRAADDWTVLGDRIEAFWDIFKYDTDLSFADNIRNSLRNAMIAVFGRDTAYGILNAWDTNIKPVLEQISGFFEQAFGDLGRVIEGIRKASEADYSNTEGNAFETFLSAFLGGYYGKDAKGAESAYTNILGVYEQIVNYYNEHVAQYVDELVKIFTVTLPNLSAQITDFLFGKEKKYVIGPGKYQTVRKGGIVQSIKDMFSQENVNEAVTSVQEFFGSISAGIGDAFNDFFEYIFGHEITGKQGNTWREGGLIQSVQELLGLEVWKEDWALIEGALEQASSWITSKGGEAWSTIMDFLFGKQEVVSDRNGANLTSHYERQGGAYEAAITFLTPVWEWIQSTGKELYEYITKHNFQEMWEGLDHLLFGYDEVVANRNGPSLTSSMVHHDGLLGPVVEVLKPIADVFGQIKGWALEKIGSIDWGGIWESLGRFFGGYDEVVASYDGGNLTSKTVHHEGIFEKIIGFFERVIDYFESPEFQEFFANVKTFYHTYIEPVFSWLGGLGGELWGAVEGLFSGQGLGALGGVATYLTNGMNKLFGKLFPDGFDLGGFLGGLFGNGQQTSDGTQTSGGKQSGKGGFSLLDLFMGTAGAAEADASAIADASNGIVAILDQTKTDVENTTNKGTGIMESILANVSQFLPYIAGAGGIALVGKVSDMITGITGNRKPTIIEQIAVLIRSFGEAFQGLGVAIAAAGFAETISPGSLDALFGHITNLINKILMWTGIIGGGGGLLSVAGNWILGKSVGGSFEGVGSIIGAIGQGLSGIFEGLQTLFNLTWEVAAADFLMGGADKFDERIDRVLGFVSKIINTVVTSSLPLELAALANSGMSALVWLAGSKNGVEPMAQMMSGLGNLITGVGDGIAAIMTASIVPGLTNVDTSKITDLISAVFAGLNGLLAIQDGSQLIDTLVGSFGKGEGTLWVSLGKLATAGTLVLVLNSIADIAKQLADWYVTITEAHMFSSGGAVYTFISNFTGALGMLASLGDYGFEAAEKVLTEDLPRILGEINSEELETNSTKMDERGKAIRDFGNRVYNGISSLSRAKDIFDKYNTDNNGFPLEFFQEMTEALQYLKGEDVTELYNSVFGQDGFWVGDKKTETDIDGLNSFFSTLGSLGWTITEFSEYNTMTGINSAGTKLESTKEGLDAFQDAFTAIQNTFHLLIGDLMTDDFDIGKMDAAGNLLTKISESAKTFVESFNTKTILNLTMKNGITKNVSTSPINLFAGWFQSLGNALHEAATAIKPEDEAGLEHINTAINSLSAFFATDLYGNIQTMSVDQIGEYTSAFYALKQSLLMPENNGGTIADTLQAVMSAAGGNSMPLKVTPVVDDSNFGRNLPGGLSMENTYSRMLDMHIDSGELLNVHIDSAQISELVAANNQTRDMVNSLSVNINEVANAVQAMKIYLDTGVLAGAVDDYLGYSAFLAGRTG